MSLSLVLPLVCIICTKLTSIMVLSVQGMSSWWEKQVMTMSSTYLFYAMFLRGKVGRIWHVYLV